MVIQETTPSFQTSVELDFVGSPGISPKLKLGEDVHLVARFKDFLGGPTSDAGPITLTATKGTIYVPNGGFTGSTVHIDVGGIVIPETGEIPIVLRPGNESGKSEVIINCILGAARLEVELPHASGFAIAEIFESIIYAFMVAIIIRIFLFQTFWIPSGSMEPTLHEKDRIVANKLIYRLRAPHRGEVIIFRVFQPGKGDIGKLTYEEAVKASEEGGNPKIDVFDYIKRVIGLPGDVVEINDGEIYVNDEPIQESFETRRPNYQHFGPKRVPAGEVFVLGDNRANSQDSHVIGPIPIRNIEGRAELVFWPPSRIGLIPQGH
jgi:signal peptidase I